MAAVAIVLGYLGIIQAAGWPGVLAAVVHLLVVLAGTWRPD